MRLSRSTWWILAAWLLLIGTYASVAMLVPPGQTLTAFGDIFQCMVPLFANAGLLLNAASPNWRRNAFWMLMALGSSLWMAGQLQWTYFEIYLRQPLPNPFVGDVIFFLHTVPMIAALALKPHEPHPDRNLRFGYLDFVLLLLWWLYLYVFIVIPWEYVAPDLALYGQSFNMVYILENLVLVIGLGILCLRAASRWRVVYAHLLGAACMYTTSSLIINVAIDQRSYYTGSLFDIPMVASFLWLGTAGIVAFRLGPVLEPALPGVPESTGGPAEPRRHESVWPSRLAMAAVLSLPALALWCLLATNMPTAIRQFRLLVTLAAIVPLNLLVFLRQNLVDADRLQLLRASQESIENLKRLQMQFVQSEKLASLGQLAAGAAHEINNPLTAILGYSDVLMDDGSIGDKARAIASKIRDQARRTKTLVNNLLSFARQVPGERTLLDVNSVVSSAVQLRGLDLRGKNINIELHTESPLPGVRGDPNQLLQIFFNIISNAVDAMEPLGGGTLTVRTLREGKNVIIEFSDTGPGIQQPNLAFDPFYTTKPVGKGTGLGLSICYGLVQEHAGRIFGFNRPEGGATFRIELPAMPALFPLRDATAPSVIAGKPTESSVPR